jgi:hypothetical protein
VALCAAFAIGFGVSGGSPSTPATSPPTSAAAKPAPSGPSVKSVASTFAKLLVSYSATDAKAYKDNESALQKEVSGNPDLAAQLLGLTKAPAGTVRIKVMPPDPPATVNASQSQVEVYVLVEQQITIRHAHGTTHSCIKNGARTLCPGPTVSYPVSSRQFLIDLTLVRAGQKWLVSKGNIWAMNALTPPKPTSAPTRGAKP